jgi:hypothetical protein
VTRPHQYDAHGDLLLFKVLLVRCFGEFIVRFLVMQRNV